MTYITPRITPLAGHTQCLPSDTQEDIIDLRMTGEEYGVMIYAPYTWISRGGGGVVRRGAGGGGALRYQMATHFQMAVRSRIGECQNIGVVNSFEGNERWGGGISNSN